RSGKGLLCDQGRCGNSPPRLHRYCSRMTGSITDGEDVVQDALFRAYRSLDTFDDSRPLAPWLFARCASPAKNPDAEEPNPCRSKRRRRSRGVPHWLSIGYHKRRIEMTVATTLDI